MTKYPRIRLFVSSTFLDMQKERDILNLEVFPYIRGACAKLGVSFTAIDLRWGITEEMQQNQDVVDLCLDEIQNCKPYFIGLIGNRYGYVPDHYDESLKEKYGFIKGNEDKSITELEMILGAIQNENKERCFFYYKSPKLCEAATSDTKEAAIEALKKNIDDASIKHEDYEDYDAFKKMVLNDLLSAIKADYPEKEMLMGARQENFLSHISSSFIPRIFMAAQAADILVNSGNRPLFVYSKSKFGKTTTFNRLIASKKEADKIIINLEADILAPRFPYYYLRELIYKGLHEYGYEFSSLQHTDLSGDRYVMCFEDNAFLDLAILRRDLLTLELERPLYILINDINLIEQHDNSKCLQNRFIFNKNDVLPDNLHVIITTNNQEQLKRYGVPYVEMHESLDDSKQFFKDYLFSYGKHIDSELLGKANPKLRYTDYKLIADYLVSYCNFASYKKSAEELLAKNDFLEILEYVYLDSVYHLSSKCASVFTEILLRLHVFEPGFIEHDLFASYDKKEDDPTRGHSVELTPLEKASIMRYLRYFTYVESGVIYVSSPYVRAFIAKRLNVLLAVLGKEYEERSRKKVEDTFSFVDAYIGQGKSMGKEEYFAYLQESETKMAEIRYAILDPLCEYLFSLINGFTETFIKEDEYSCSLDYANDSSLTVLLYVQESAKLFKDNTRADLYYELLKNKDLMYFVASKSLLSVRRLITDFIFLNRSIQTRQYGKEDDSGTSLLIAEAFKCWLDDNGTIRDNIVMAVSSVLEELDMPETDFTNQAGEGRIFLTEFASEACSVTVLQSFYDDYSVAFDNQGEGDLEVLERFHQSYTESTLVFDKIYYAARYLDAAIESINAETFSPEYQEKTNVIWTELNDYLSYCFFPEINALFSYFEGRFSPIAKMQKMGDGLDYLLSIGVQKSVGTYAIDYEYFLEENKS